MDNRTILNVAVRSHTDGFNVASQHGGEPDAGVVADLYIADDVRTARNKRRRGDTRNAPAVAQYRLVELKGNDC